MLKRPFDVVVGVIGLIALSPLLLVLSLIVKFTSKGPVFYRAKRVGQHGKEFRLFKFRSMVVNADKIGPGVTGSGDPRITPVGHILRKTKMDELPQLFNVIKGEMSFVGPRPEDPRYVALYTDEQRQILDVRPGITSLATVKYRDEEAMLTSDDWETYYIEEVMPAKIAIDLKYVQNAGLIRDIGIILSTLLEVVRPTHPNQDM